MKIIIREANRKGITIPIPMFCITGMINGISLAEKFARKSSKESLEGKNIAETLKCIDKKALKKGFRQLKKSCKGMTILEVEEKNGDYVKIIM